MAQMTRAKERRRERFENVLMTLGTASVLLNCQVRLRISQAIQRDERLADLLAPAIETLDEQAKAIGQARSLLGEIHRDRDIHGW